MKTKIVLALVVGLFSANLWADAVPGKPAPAFSVKDQNGQLHELNKYAGKWLVLEWFNKDCPYVRKHYDSGNMQALQKKFTDQEVVWLSVISSAKGKQGFLHAKAVDGVMKDNKMASTSVLLDVDGVMGKAYGAKTTPHMFVINPKGEVVYAGAIDDNDSANPDVIAKSKNLVSEALTAGMSGKPVAVASSKPYGCAVKY